jgi:uncharacterized protein YegP (UPF0339 family)
MTTQIKGDATSTFGSDIDVTGNIVTDAPAFSVTLSANQSMATSTNTKIQWDTSEFDLTDDFDTTTNYRFTPSVEGYYLFNFNLFMDANNTQLIFRGQLYKNGSLHKRGLQQADSIATDTTANGSILAYANGTTDYFELYMYHNLGSTRNLQSNSSLNYFQGFLVRAV